MNKYIVFGYGYGKQNSDYEFVVLLPEDIRHCDVKIENLVARRAGIFGIIDGKVSVSGSSVSLGISCDKEKDVKLIQNLIKEKY